MNKIYLGQLITGLFLIFLLPLQAQKLDHVQGQLLVMFEEEVNPESFIKKLDVFDGRKTRLDLVEQISIPLNIWKIRFDYTKINERRLLAYFERLDIVIGVQFNHFTEYRRKPNDPEYNQQWHFLNTGQTGGTPGVDLDIERVWDITTGGLSPTGDTVVVCVLDDGLDPSHQDFGDNIWVNYAEIPNNGIDDDNNGFIDDVNGWNAFFDNDDIDDENVHGTPVAGVIGAKGNNGIGSTGVAWNIKLMIVSGGANTEAENIQAFSYALTHRIKYNETNGQEGAFVVATNFSQGVTIPSDINQSFPLWCALIDEMGEQGILTLAAAPNEMEDVDQVRDYPAQCSSEYLMMITSVDANGAYIDAGFGATTIDMAAFGEEIWTTTNGNTTDFETGTSFATPLVAGAVALLYTSPCLSLSTIADSDPAGAALLARDLIYDGLISEPTLAGRTVTGGYLNIGNSIDAYLNNCSNCNPPTSLVAIGTTDQTTTLEWNNNDSISQVDLRFRRVGQAEWQTITAAISPLSLNDLLACASYEVQLNTFCGTEELGFGNSFFFKTDGCCEPPADLSLLLDGEEQVLVGWAPLFAARTYNVRYRIEGDEDWIELVTSESAILLQGLQECSPYEVQVQTNCDTLLTEYSASLLFETLGCGSCTDLEYCVIRNANNSGEWIEEIRLAGFENKSGQDAESFAIFTDLEGPTLAIDSTYEIFLLPGFPGRSFSQYFKIWIDYNQDGFFTSGEVAFDPGSATRDTLIGSIQVPTDALVGRTRMRVVMNFNVAGGACTLSGGGNSIPGEVEDYCVNIVESTIPCCAPDSINLIDRTDELLTFAWGNEVCNATAHIVRYRLEGEAEWANAFAENGTINLTGLQECSNYEIQVQGLCGSDFSDFSASFVYNTACRTNSTSVLKTAYELRFAPNPAHDILNISFNSPKRQQLNTALVDLTGRVLLQQNTQVNTGVNNLSLNVLDLPSGVYFVAMSFEDGKVVEKIIIE